MYAYVYDPTIIYIYDSYSGYIYSETNKYTCIKVSLGEMFIRKKKNRKILNIHQFKNR